MRSRALAESGFTLVELMVVVVIATILLSIAVPSYMSQVRESRRTEAKTAIMDLAGREESYFSTNGSTYTASTTALGYSNASTWATALTPSGYYLLNVCISGAGGGAPACDGNANAPNGPAYYITATPQGTQVNDTLCGTFGLDSTGTQFSSGTQTVQTCWGN
jgi:type IV pilus assembly protein PilE